MKVYNTSQRQAIIDYLLKNSDKQYTVEQLTEGINNIGKSTIYRLVNRMVEEGIVRRSVIGNSRQFGYQYCGQESCATHLHLKCRQCGKILHMDDDESKKLFELLHDSKQFDLDIKDTLLMGKCEQCNINS